MLRSSTAPISSLVSPLAVTAALAGFGLAVSTTRSLTCSSVGYAGEYLLIHAAAGGVGLAALQIGKALGAKVIAACSTQAKLDVCLKNGADFAVNYAEGAKGDWQKKVMEITKGHGADV